MTIIIHETFHFFSYFKKYILIFKEYNIIKF